MDGGIVPILFLLTLLSVAVFALVSKERVDRRRQDPTAPKSTLAKDGPQHGIATLQGPTVRPEDKPAARPVLD